MRYPIIEGTTDRCNTCKHFTQDSSHIGSLGYCAIEPPNPYVVYAYGDYLACMKYEPREEAKEMSTADRLYTIADKDILDIADRVFLRTLGDKLVANNERKPKSKRCLTCAQWKQVDACTVGICEAESNSKTQCYTRFDQVACMQYTMKEEI